MALFKGMKQSRERKKAKSFFENAANLDTQTREARKIRAVLGNRTTAAIDMTFIDGAQRWENYAAATQAALLQGRPKPKPPVSSCFKEVKTLSGHVWVYLPQHYSNQFFTLGAKYQRSEITPSRAVEVAVYLAAELTEYLELDHPILPLGFLIADTTEKSDPDPMPAEPASIEHMGVSSEEEDSSGTTDSVPEETPAPDREATPDPG